MCVYVRTYVRPLPDVRRRSAASPLTSHVITRAHCGRTVISIPVPAKYSKPVKSRFRGLLPGIWKKSRKRGNGVRMHARMQKLQQREASRNGLTEGTLPHPLSYIDSGLVFRAVDCGHRDLYVLVFFIT